MIYIRVEMWPGGFKKRARLLGEATIANVGGERSQCDYEVKLLKSPEYARPGNVGSVWKGGIVRHFPRQRLGPWDLLLRALLATVAYRNREAVREVRA
jgi:hypothetical protein